ncbi:hypothetical protein [Plectonema phage JingP1]|uniref:Uncharacterized protein n=1 Tax=Plectonema phage JingP1 TaxID=2961687 RepID=A0A9E7T1I3_9CAUD|nr:hypothetical protein [Plectonema phage JingP1]
MQIATRCVPVGVRAASRVCAPMYALAPACVPTCARVPHGVPIRTPTRGDARLPYMYRVKNFFAYTVTYTTRIPFVNYLQLLTQIGLILSSTKLKGDKAAYLACRTIASRFEQRNPGIYSEVGYTQPIPPS